MSGWVSSLYVDSSVALEILAPTRSERSPAPERQAPTSIRQFAVRTQHTALLTKRHFRPNAVSWAQLVGSHAARAISFLSWTTTGTGQHCDYRNSSCLHRSSMHEHLCQYRSFPVAVPRLLYFLCNVPESITLGCVVGN